MVIQDGMRFVGLILWSSLQKKKQKIENTTEIQYGLCYFEL